MRLDCLTIPSYRNLQSFTIDFDECQATTVLIGRNGSGKSNLFEAIVEIFRELESGGPPPFAYILEYSCRDHKIRIDADPGRASKRLAISVDGTGITQAAFKQGLQDLLPNYIFAYYSGWSSRLERHFDRPTRKHYAAILNARHKQFPLRRMFFCRKEYSQLVLLAFFLEKTAAARDLLEKYLGIKGFVSALFVLKTPWWRGSGAPKKIQLEEGDARFWYARGAFKDFLDRLWECSLAPIRNSETVDRDVRRQGETTERLYLFV
ncbi:AAA family ATPase [Synechococcus sp. CBW1006]|uniref:AAA family ATPase n=1 Tax=Synechococcus sp. CBW1006 TaxID=1353138 RepID=UPI0018CEB3A1|nr:AAA family ATPase [Synechococcus sp. CBW1006]QPN66248.1 AAA family ATPase [Synechococcus sp. CBW1006]